MSCLLVSALLHGLVLSVLAPVRVPARKHVADVLQVRFQSEKLNLALQTSVLQDFQLNTQANIDPRRTLDLIPDIESVPENVVEQGPAPLIPVPIEHYYKSTELDVQPVPNEVVQPEYPEQAFSGKQEGWVRLLLLIDEYGQIRSIEVVESTPPGMFDQAAIMAFRKKEFKPGQRSGGAVKSRLLLRIDFSLQQELNPLSN